MCQTTNDTLLTWFQLICTILGVYIISSVSKLKKKKPKAFWFYLRLTEFWVWGLGLMIWIQEPRISPQCTVLIRLSIMSKTCTTEGKGNCALWLGMCRYCESDRTVCSTGAANSCSMLKAIGLHRRCLWAPRALDRLSRLNYALHATWARKRWLLIEKPKEC